jgi:hypothetical protein
MLDKIKEKSTDNAKKSEHSARGVVVTVWNFALDLVWLSMVVCVVSLFIWGLVRSGVAADQTILTTVADKVDVFIMGMGGDK